MSVIEAERAAPPAPPPSWSTGWWNLGLRAALLLALVLAAAVASPSLRPHQTTPQNFVGDLRAGVVRHLQYDRHTEDLRWSVSWMNWYQVDLALGHPSVAGDSSTDTGSEPDLTWVHAALKETDSAQSLTITDSGDRLAWAQRLPWDGLGAAAKIAAAAAFLMMLFRGGGRFGNRWAWFWVMISTSGLGAALYLALEPWPVWQRPSRQRPMPARPAFLGGAGLLLAILVRPAVSLLSMLVAS